MLQSMKRKCGWCEKTLSTENKRSLYCDTKCKYEAAQLRYYQHMKLKVTGKISVCDFCRTLSKIRKKGGEKFCGNCGARK